LLVRYEKYKDIEEVFYVASGEVDFRTENGVYKAKTGDKIRIPLGGVVHAFKNTSDSDARLICTVYPAGLDEMFAEISASDPLNAKVIGEKFGN
jgi:quercetin dioxygenase-like cupin family protein